ncbi:MarR family transcriptional regulator [Salinibacterium sp. SWN139]|uniref:MarR family winged helix-turn-helix transcriptional regulator n=1 Tax=unclassified Salinibacterium TaxID=2632331 RepID=UPI0018CC9696|nr:MULTISPECIES: MarR family transcriptional regulator [unclassified Salinibacterium]MBH0023031.1 MarR family transcriptional regulator [Salinibacterium sp. SWN248]MBH0053052.1 MarR family transcriptional regulator [Salinibacterium sp. SWN139]
MTQQATGIDLETSLGYLLKEASSALRSSMEAVLRPHGMNITHYSCLELLAQRPGLSNSELARGAFVTRQAMNVLLQSLERDGLITRAEQPVAGRVLPAELTVKGRGQLATASAAVKEVEDRMKSTLNAGEQAMLGDLLSRCVTSLREQPASVAQQAGSRPRS